MTRAQTCWIVGVLAAAFPLLLFAKNGDSIELKDVSYHVTSASTEVIIETTGPFEYRSDRVNNPDRVYFDFFNVRPSTQYARSGTRRVDGGLVRQFRIGTNKLGNTRVVFDVANLVSYSANRVAGTYRLVIEFWPANAPGPPPSRSPLPQSAPSSSDVDAPAAPSVTTPITSRNVPDSLPRPAKLVPRAESLTRALGLSINRIVIDAGHGGSDNGAIGESGVREKDVVLDVAFRLADLLTARTSAEVYLTRSDDTFVPLQDRTAFANSKRADIFLSIHANSAPAQFGAGTETYFLSLTNSAIDLAVAAGENATSGKSVAELQDLIASIARSEKVTESQAFARAVQTSLFAEARRSNPSIQNRGVKRAPFVVLIGAAMPSVLAEIGFLNNASDEANLGRPEYRANVADALFKGLAAYAQSLGHFELATRTDDRDQIVHTTHLNPRAAQEVGHLKASPAALKAQPVPRFFEVHGVRWSILDTDCIAHDAALQKVPEGFELPGDDELSELSRTLNSPSSKEVLAAFPFLSRTSSTFWTNHLQPISDRWLVVRLSDGEVRSQVPDSCAYVLARQSEKPK